MIFGKRKVDCVFCKKRTPKKTAFTINMNTIEGMHQTFACPKCAKEFDEIAQYVEKNIERRTYTI